MENVFDALCSALSDAAVKLAFLDGEGTELMCLMLKEKKLSRTRAIKTLDHALQGTAGIPLCEKFVEMLGLKTLFSAFMGKVRARPLPSPSFSLSSRSSLSREDELTRRRNRAQAKSPNWRRRPPLRARLTRTSNTSCPSSPPCSPPSPPTRPPVCAFYPNLSKTSMRKWIG
jgi:hypothetical protein